MNTAQLGKMLITSAPLGRILLAGGKITQPQLERALALQAETKQLLGEILVAQAMAKTEDVVWALGRQLNIPVFKLDDDFRLEAEEIRLLPVAIARRYCLFPMKKNGNAAMTLVMSDPLNSDALATVRSLTKLEIHRAVGAKEQILAVIERFYRQDAHIERSLEDIVRLEADGAGGVVAEADDDQLRVQANDAPVVRFVNLLLMQAIRDHASDIHLEPGEKGADIRMRIDGVLHEITPPPPHLYQGIVTRIKILSTMDIAERRLPLDGRFKFKVDLHEVDVRVSSLPEVYGEKLVLRILDKQALVVDMHDIGFDEDMLKNFQRILRLPHGIVLLTGPTGSGKTTTLYSALNFLKSPEKNIQTVEDPVEYLVPGVNQMPIRPKIGLDFASALRAILRQDPNIIMIGEIRDADTAEIAMRASLTGHLVLSTLHTNDATSAFGRLKDIGVEPYLIAATIKLVIAQRLVRVLCSDCKQPHPLAPEQLLPVTHERPEAAAWTFYRSVGCAKCHRAGFRGRKGIFEFLEVTESIRKMIFDGTDTSAIRQKARDQGMQTLFANGLNKIKQGITTVEEVLKVSELDEI
jgi:type IV pilus assembly protein PilB